MRVLDRMHAHPSRSSRGLRRRCSAMRSHLTSWRIVLAQAQFNPRSVRWVECAEAQRMPTLGDATPAASVAAGAADSSSQVRILRGVDTLICLESRQRCCAPQAQYLASPRVPLRAAPVWEVECTAILRTRCSFEGRRTSHDQPTRTPRSNAYSATHGRGRHSTLSAAAKLGRGRHGSQRSTTSSLTQWCGARFRTRSHRT